MNKFVFKISFLFILLILFSIQGSTSLEQKNQIQFNQAQLKNEESPQNPSLNPDFGAIPLYFIPNEGQVDEKALFYAKASRYTLWLTKEGLVFDSTRRTKKESTNSNRLSPEDINNHKDYKYDRDISRLIFINANTKPDVVPLNDTEHKVNYFIGDDESKWRTDIQTSSAVLYKEVYPNIDLKVYGVEQQIEYDFVVKPEGEVSDIGFEYKDVEKTRIDKEGNLVIKTKFGELEHTKPVCYQVIGGERVEIQAEFMKIGDNNYGFKVEDYNKNYELIIDPVVLVYSTYLGGLSYKRGYGIAVDSKGAAYVTGYQASYGRDWTYAFITKINASGSALVYSTYLGGSYDDCGNAIAVDSEGAAYVTGDTDSVDFPTRNPIQGSLGGGWSDAFITKISSSGKKLIYSTYLGGSEADWGEAIAVDSEGAAYVTGETDSVDFPTRNPIQDSYGGGGGDAFITKISSSGSALVYSTYLGGLRWERGEAIAVDSEGAAYVTGVTESTDFPTRNPIQRSYGGGFDAFITKISSSGKKLIYSTYLGGSYSLGGSYLDNGGSDNGRGIAVDSEGAAYITGETDSVDFPTRNPIQDSLGGGWSDAFITKINASGRKLIYSTYLGGFYYDSGKGIAVDSEGAAYITGETDSVDFPTRNPIQDSYGGGGGDAFITKISSSGSALVYSTYLGGSYSDGGKGIAVDSEGAAYVTGWTRSIDFPTLNPIQGSKTGQHVSFIAKIASYYSLTIASSEGGTTRPKPGTHPYYIGAEAHVEAIPDEGFKFSHWSGDASGTDNPIEITMDSDKSVTANFIGQYKLTITSGPGGTTDPAPGIYTYDSGTEVTLTATPENGYRFGEWSGDVSSADNPITIAMNSDISIKANFIRQYTLTLTSGPGGTTQPSPGTYVYDEGTEVTISCIPDTHCRFSHWSGDASGMSDPLTITMDSDKSITANFIRIIYAPLNSTGQKVLNRSLSQVEYINFLTWKANPNNVSIVKYRIYHVEGDTQSLLVELNANTFDYWHRGVERDKQYTYALVAVNNEGREGDKAFITVQ